MAGFLPGPVKVKVAGGERMVVCRRKIFTVSLRSGSSEFSTLLNSLTATKATEHVDRNRALKPHTSAHKMSIKKKKKGLKWMFAEDVSTGAWATVARLRPRRTHQGLRFTSAWPAPVKSRKSVQTRLGTRGEGGQVGNRAGPREVRSFTGEKK